MFSKTAEYCPKGICELKSTTENCSFRCDNGNIMDIFPCIQMLFKMVGILDLFLITLQINTFLYILGKLCSEQNY